MPVRLSRPASKAARSNHRHEFRPTGDALLRAGEYQLGQVISKALAALSRTIATDFIEGRINQIEFVELTVESLEPYRGEIDRALYRIALDEARDMNARIRKTINGELRQLGSPVRLVMPETIRKAAGVDLEWATTLASFDAADPTLPMRVATRNQTSGILSGLAASEQNTIMAQISAGFTESQTFSTGRTVVGRTVQQTARSIVPILQEAAGTTMALAPGELAIYRSQYTNGLFPRWAQAVNNYADSQAGSLARQGITGRRALDVVDKRTAKYSDKLRRSRARMIARTETSIAQNQAMLGVMKDAQRQGLVSTRARKQWVTGPFDVCKICEGLNGVKVQINQSFPGIGRAHPPAHPNCRCIIELVPDYSRSPEPIGTGTPQDPFRYRFPDGWEAPINPVTTFAPSLLSPVAPPPLPPTPAPASTSVRRGNMADEFELPKGKRTREIADPVLSKMDDAGIRVEQGFATGKTEVSFGKASDDVGGWYSPRKRGKKPRQKPVSRANYATREEYVQAVRDARRDLNERLLAYIDDGFGSRSRLRVNGGSTGSQQNTLTHEIGHRLDVVEDHSIFRTTQAVKNAKANNPGVDFLDIPLSNVNPEHRAMMELLQAIERSEARSVLASFGETSARAAEYVRYGATPEELWARSFNQWFTKNHGTPEMIADMLAQTTHPLFTTSGQITGDQWIGFQWRAAEFDDKIAPLVEKVLRQRGIIE